MQDFNIPVTKKKSIFEIQSEYLTLLHELEDNEGLFTEEMEKKYAINLTDLEYKLKAYAALVAKAESDIEAIKLEKKRLDKMSKFHTNLKDRLKLTIKDAVELYGDTNKKTGTKSIRYDTIYFYTRKGYKLVFDNIETFKNPKFIVFTVDGMYTQDEINKLNNAIEDLEYAPRLKNKELLVALKEGEEVKGVTYEKTSSVTIK